ncbi:MULTISPECIES: hypothetical protein [Sphingobacterium]|uniref:hypothetical protein n=1 Tax=Sphingobacterium TaxID=28453 RepID=UPI00289E0B83|nr:hypothetical protein [Sphingobacterium sp.]
MIVKLTKNQFDYLDYSLSEQEGALRTRLQINKENQFVFIELDEETADEIRDWAMDKQVQVGFDENYELTSEGTILEELVDAFYIE